MSTNKVKHSDGKEPDNKKKEPEMINFGRFFTFITPKDKLLIAVGSIAAVIAGVIVPCMAIAMGSVTNAFNPTESSDERMNTMKLICLYICLVGLGGWLFGYVYYAFWQHMAQNVSFDLRSRYLHAILRQEVAYFEMNDVEQLPSQIGENFFIVTESIGEKFSNVIFSFATVIGGLGISFYKGADFAGVCCAFLPVIVISLGIFGGQVKKATMAKMEITKQLGGVVEESLSAIRLVASFANEDKETVKFNKLAIETMKVSHKQETWTSFLVGFFKALIFGYYVYSFYIASIYIEKGYRNPSNNH